MEGRFSDIQDSDLLCMLSARIDAQSSLRGESYEAVELEEQKVTLLQNPCNVQKMGLCSVCKRL